MDKRKPLEARRCLALRAAIPPPVPLPAPLAPLAPSSLTIGVKKTPKLKEFRNSQSSEIRR